MLCLCNKIICKRLIRNYRAKSSYTDNNLNLKEILENMSFNRRSKADASRAYATRKENIQKYIGRNKILKIEVLGNGTPGAPRSVHICTDTLRYVFNFGEGSQRLANEYKIKLTKSPHVFITYPSWENVSGLLGMALTLQGIGIPEVFLHGPRVIENVFSATNKFVALRSITVRLIDCLKNSEFDDGTVNIKYVPLYPSQNGTLNKNQSDSKLAVTTTTNDCTNKTNTLPEIYCEDDDDIDYYEHIGKGKRAKITLPNKKKKPRSQSVECKGKSYNKFSMCYIFRSKDAPGTLLIEKCVDLGVPCGPLFGKLKNGEDITLEDGTVIKSTDVTGPVFRGGVILVVECPLEDYLDSLLEEPAFYRHQCGDESNIADAVIHFTHSTVMEHSKYKEWMNRFPKTTKHLLINGKNNSLGSVGVQRMQYKLNLLHSEIFPLLPDPGIPHFPRNNLDVPSEHTVVDVKSLKEEEKQLFDDSNVEDNLYKDKIYFNCGNNPIIRGQTLCEVYLRPKRPYDYSYSLVLKTDEYKKEAFLIDGFQEEYEKLKLEIKNTQLDKGTYPKVLFLGTGSSQPSKTRNTSGILVFFDEKTYILLDCGEATYGQLVQFFGLKKAKEILRNLKVIYVSHLHADHHIGLITLLRERKTAYEEITLGSKQNYSKANEFQPVILLAPIQLTRWLNLFNEDFERISELYTLIPNALLNDLVYFKSKFNQCLKLLNLKEIKTTLVDHCPHAFGVALLHNDGWKITYSGDTKPCQNLVELGMNTDILIHEATMDDSLEKAAAIKLHSTTSQAIQIGKQMKAKFIILTHFSQRYAHLPLFNESFTGEVGVAFDNMMVSMNQLPILSKFQEPLKLMFSKYYESMQWRKSLSLLRKENKKKKQSMSPEIN